MDSRSGAEVVQVAASFALGAFSQAVWQVWVKRVTRALVPAGGFFAEL